MLFPSFLYSSTLVDGGYAVFLCNSDSEWGSHFPLIKCIENNTARSTQSMTMAIQMLNIPSPAPGIVTENTVIFSSDSMYARPIRIHHMETVETVREYLTSPAALNTLGNMNAGGRMSDVHIA